MRSSLVKSVFLALVVTAGNAGADTLKIPLGQQGGQQIKKLPARGESQTSVLHRYGEPVKRHASVGQPPITRWDYAEFSVYFEHSHVINSVHQHRRQQP